MDQVIAYWQEMGVDGFRGDMSHWTSGVLEMAYRSRAPADAHCCLYWRGLR